MSRFISFQAGRSIAMITDSKAVGYEASFGPCTIYLSGFIGVQRIECRTAKVRRRPYAQHENAIELTYVRKGARKEQWDIKYTPSALVVILPGHNTPKPDDPYTTDEQGNGRSRHLSCDPAWNAEFAAKVKDQTVLFSNGI